jgi:hypothetical protein
MLRRTAVPTTHCYNRRPSALGGSTIALGRFLFPFLFLALITGCAPRRAHAQFIGYSAPQTNQQTLATNAACTGGAANFLVNNFGQISHLAQITAITSTVQSLSIVIQGSTDGVNFVTISDFLNLNGVSFPLGTGITASGYYPVVRVQVTCGPSGGGRTFSLSYSGVAGAITSGLSGTFLSSAIDKQLAASAPAGSNSTSLGGFTPFGNLSGQIAFQYTGGAGPSGSTLTLTCQQATGGAMLTQVFTLATTGNVVQTFAAPPAPCTSYTVLYTSGGASAVTYSLDYNFTYPGTLPVGDPCQSPGNAKSSVPINITTATTTQLVALSGTKTIYVCGASFTIAPSGTTADTILFEFGTGASCGTGTTALTGAFGAGDLTTTTGVTPITLADPGVSITAPAGNALCAVSAGTTVNIQGVLQFVQQ